MEVWNLKFSNQFTDSEANIDQMREEILNSECEAHIKRSFLKKLIMFPNENNQKYFEMCDS